MCPRVRHVGTLGLRAAATVMSYELAYLLWDQGSMAWKPVEGKGYIPGTYSLAERAGDKHYRGRRESVRTPAGGSPCNSELCLAEGLLACTSLKDVCTTLRVWALGLAGCGMAA